MRCVYVHKAILLADGVITKITVPISGNVIKFRNEVTAQDLCED